MRGRRLFVIALVTVLGLLATRLAVAPLGDAIAGEIAPHAKPHMTPPPPTAGRATEDTEPEQSPLPTSRLAAVRATIAGPPRGIRAAREAKDGGAPEDVLAGTIVVPAAVVARALEKHDVGARNASAADGTPLGARLVGVGKYRTGLRDGDVVVAVAGTRTTTVQAMVGAALSAASGATRLTGRIVRGESTYAVVIELPQ